MDGGSGGLPVSRVVIKAIESLVDTRSLGRLSSDSVHRPLRPDRSDSRPGLLDDLSGTLRVTGSTTTSNKS